jgi:hypothetical protein
VGQRRRGDRRRTEEAAAWDRSSDAWLQEEEGEGKRKEGKRKKRKERKREKEEENGKKKKKRIMKNPRKNRGISREIRKGK